MQKNNNREQVQRYTNLDKQNQLQRKVQRITNSDTQSKLEGTVQAKQKICNAYTKQNQNNKLINK